MTEKFKYPHLILLIFCFIFFIKCKSEKHKIVSNTDQIVATTNVGSDNNDIDKYDSIEIIKSTSDSIKNVQTTGLNTAQEEDIEESLDSIKIEEEPVQTKPEKVIIKKKPKKVFPAKMPKINFEELTWDFGEITEGDIIEKKFKFKNTGLAPLEIIATSATCGCTRPSFPFLDIAPGDSNVIGVNYNSVGKEGEQSAEVTIESNTIPKITTIKLYGTVKPNPKNKEKLDSKTSVKDTLTYKQ